MFYGETFLRKKRWNGKGSHAMNQSNIGGVISNETIYGFAILKKKIITIHTNVRLKIHIIPHFILFRYKIHIHIVNWLNTIKIF